MSLPSPFPVAPPSEPFKISPSTYLRYSLGGATGRVGIVIAAIAVLVPAAVAMATSDLRFLMLSFILLFLAVPLVMALVYYSITLSPEAVRSTLLHSVELLDNGSILITYINTEEDTHEEKSENRIDSELTPKLETIDRHQIRSLRISQNYIVYHLESNRLVIIPKKSLILSPESYCQFRDFI